jgi:hypothetical protein
MGHIRLGRLPKTYKWREVFDALDDDNLTGEMLANAISSSAQDEFESLKGDQSLSFCFWVLAYVVSSAKTDSFLNRLEKLGVNTKNINSGLDFAKSFSSFISQSLNEIGRPNAFANIAELSVNETITNILVNQTKTLFGTKIDDIQVAFKKTATKKQFGLISRQFFATFLTRSLQFVTDKEISNYIGKNKTIGSSSDVMSLQKALSTYCYQSSKIVEEFSGGWFSKQSWQTKNNITYDSAKGFMAYAIEKVNMDLRGESA